MNFSKGVQPFMVAAGRLGAKFIAVLPQEQSEVMYAGIALKVRVVGLNSSLVTKNGGIDLTNIGMTVTQDAAGGVKINLDPAMIARIKAQGVQSAVPIVINVAPINFTQILPLLGFDADQSSILKENSA